MATVKIYFRTVHIPWDGEPEPTRVIPEVGRWPSNSTLYTGSSVDVVWAEFCRNHHADVDAADMTGGIGIDLATLHAIAEFILEPPVPSRALYELTFDFRKMADLTTPASWEILAKADFDVADFFSDQYGECPDLAEHAVAQGWEALRVPSAAWRLPGAYCVPIFEPGMRRFRSARLVEAAAAPTVRVSVGTSYRSGERPSWMLPRSP